MSYAREPIEGDRSRKAKFTPTQLLLGHLGSQGDSETVRDREEIAFSYDPLFLVSTIHSFAWSQIQGFNADIRAWLNENLQRELADLQSEEEKGRAGTKASAARQVQIESKQRRLDRLASIKTFTYNPTGDNRERNALNHSEVIKIFSTFLLMKPLMQRMFVEKFPFLLIDESQDTSRALIDAFLAVQKTHAHRFCLGLIGDTMQRIYPDGKERIESEIPPSWATPEKRLNHRCPRRIVRLINQIRSGADDHKQEPRDDRPEGWVRLFVFSADTPDKAALEERVRDHMVALTGDVEWADAGRCKILTLEHHMAARRMAVQGTLERLLQAVRGTSGHLVLHRHIARPAERTRHKVLEQQAHRFAGAFLLPAETFAAEVRVPPTLDDLLLLKRRWGASAAAIIMRLQALELLDTDGTQLLFKRRSARWGAKSEPGDDERAPEQPRLLRRTIELLVAEKVMPLDSIPRHIGLAAMDVESLTGLPEGYFNGKANVVEFARLKPTTRAPDERREPSDNVIQFRPSIKN